ncbi:hypothetical protein BI330_23225 [Mycobacterium sp. CBMA 623]|nr:hypothetical protein [Mycobacteroides sp. CBMA 326]
MDDYYLKVRAQEQLYVSLGLPADGLTDFLVTWFHAWEQRSVTLLRDCFADEMIYADPSTGGRDWIAGQTEFDFYHQVFRAFPDMVFYPPNDTIQALPYFDFLDGNVRITVPWRQIGRLRFTPRAVDVVGVDRYNLIRDPQRGWLIARIDTDCDLLGVLGQLMPIAIRFPRQRTVQFLMRTAQRLFPSLRGPRVTPMSHEIS